ncbi:MAG: NAD(P)-dependent oxidoreductase [Rhodospirillales bacterium RIFCSPLOWO2_12_FULL_58_28]|nr:MAG: NAD(P)-dependent oxidoreductase [Rhodospirillales bacterium RIFCSPLOWO2_02_FULL_58_16]OHC78168.1 MAG: NAD(P)-dependent oxidoreductase [Rhodospirillales bacterium RIFCSPLOWO2_12_FULL_58_28]
MNKKPPHLFCFGLGYSARTLAGILMDKGWTVTGTCRDKESVNKSAATGIKAFLFDGQRPFRHAATALKGVTHLLTSVPPDAEGDPVLRHHQKDLSAVKGLAWIGYLSTTGVYGDTGGRMVDESAPLLPTSERSRLRVEAEKQWRTATNIPAHIFRLSGIYGPANSVLDRVRDGTARRIDKPGHLFSRIHVDDIAGAAMASMARPDPGAVYNLADDLPATAAEVTAFACELLGVKPPPLIPFDEAAGKMSPMALSFWRDNRLVDNTRIKKELAVRLIHPDYRSGLRAILAAETR